MWHENNFFYHTCICTVVELMTHVYAYLHLFKHTHKLHLCTVRIRTVYLIFVIKSRVFYPRSMTHPAAVVDV